MKFLVILVSLCISSLFFSQDYKDNFAQAQEEAAAENKKIILVFSGSDWCVNCMKLEKQILSTDEFKSAIDKNTVFVNADFPQKKKNKDLQAEAIKIQNDALAEKYNPEGVFPLVVVIDSNQKEIAKVFYENISPSQFAEKLNSFIQK